MIITIKCKRHPAERLGGYPRLTIYDTRTNEWEVDTSEAYCHECYYEDMNQPQDVTIEVVS